MQVSLRSTLKKILPDSVKKMLLRVMDKQRIWSRDRKFREKSPEFIFTSIYRDHYWGSRDDSLYMSGHGSHHEKYVTPYVKGLSGFLQELSSKPVIADLGCGDFNVGAQLAHLGLRYIACDVVRDLVETLEEKNALDNVEFRVVDIINDSLPTADIYLVRQVLQHLSNSQVQKFLANVAKSKPEYLIVSEYTPKSDFIPNIDQPCGSHSRIARGINSGIVITESPFNMKFQTEQLISETDDGDAVLKTIAYKF